MGKPPEEAALSRANSESQRNIDQGKGDAEAEQTKGEEEAERGKKAWYRRAEVFSIAQP